ncbi:helix-turn-helix domain-containing protein [Rhizorhabdus sp.]|uniref:helix-turn-helix domain-containing protein n=1 Tax=Rhizorhabdus sp. TaxID=1968843 RepID=UPI0019CE2B90|nr:helix-turn-helix domain-containing protein [Rhizorhabdus sp.]MBD3761916.1 helix-turn-helix domain-containing protein [Rhizorhabdus sp.]
MLVPINEAAKTLGIGRTLLYRLIRLGELEMVRLGSRSLVTRSSIEALIERKTGA